MSRGGEFGGSTGQTQEPGRLSRCVDDPGPSPFPKACSSVGHAGPPAAALGSSSQALKGKGGSTRSGGEREEGRSRARTGLSCPNYVS